jgi:DNA (cytosine-5)-methyltransferase 1
MQSVELFTGCGGLGLGLSRAGFEHQLLVEWNRDAVETVIHNKNRKLEHIAHWPVIRGDVREIDWTPYKNAALVAGGPPCQPFSIGGKHKGHQDDRDMWPQAIRAVREISPSAFIFENVRGLARPKFADYLRMIVEQLRNADGLKIGYHVSLNLVNAADFGAPQKRHRLVIVGIRRDQASSAPLLMGTHSRERLLWDQWISGTYWNVHGISAPKSGPANGDWAAISRLQNSRIKPPTMPWITVRDAIRDLGEPDGTGNHCFQSGARVYKGHTGSPLDQPAKALKAGDHGVPGGENMMVRDDGSVRYFSIREAARLQGLPDDYEFPRSWSESMRQLGNAVPTQLSAAVGETVRRHICSLQSTLLAA